MSWPYPSMLRGVLLTLSPALAANVTPVAEGHYRLIVGDDEVIALSDGAAVRLIKDVLPGAPTADDATAVTRIPINALLIRTGKTLILVDTGAGGLLGPDTGGHLGASLSAVGVRPEQIGAILLTHAHPDHIGGLCANGKRLFPNADVYVDQRELLRSPVADGPQESPKPRALRYFQDVMIRPYEVAGHLRTFDGATDLFPGVRSLPAYGHSAGHTAYLITSRGQRLLLWGDVVHVADVQFAEPHLSVASDFDGQAAVATRLRLFSWAANNDMLVGGAHLPFPGLGHVHFAPGAGSFPWTPFLLRSGKEADGTPTTLPSLACATLIVRPYV